MRRTDRLGTSLGIAALIFGIAAYLALFTAAACTQQQRAKHLGGTATVELPPCRKLVHVTWKDDQLWYLTREAVPGDKAETYQFQESSSFGIIEGTVVVQEKPCQ